MGEREVLVKAISSYVQRQPGFCARESVLAEGTGAIEVGVTPRAGTRPWCSGCEQSGAGYDRLGIRRFELVPRWRLAVFLGYVMRRVDGPRCGVRVEALPWAECESQLTTTYAWFLAGWAKRLSWREVAQTFWAYTSPSRPANKEAE